MKYDQQCCLYPVVIVLIQITKIDSSRYARRCQVIYKSIVCFTGVHICNRGIFGRFTICSYISIYIRHKITAGIYSAKTNPDIRRTWTCKHSGIPLRLHRYYLPWVLFVLRLAAVAALCSNASVPLSFEFGPSGFIRRPLLPYYSLCWLLQVQHCLATTVTKLLGISCRSEVVNLGGYMSRKMMFLSGGPWRLGTLPWIADLSGWNSLKLGSCTSGQHLPLASFRFLLTRDTLAFG